MSRSGLASTTGRTVLLALLTTIAACTNGRVDPRPAQEGIWSIRCAAFSGRGRTGRARNCATALQNVAALNPELVRVLNVGDECVVYYGEYERRYDPGTLETSYTPDALPDMNLIRSLSVTTGGQNTWPFIYAIMEELPTAGSENRAWDLAQARGYWSLHVAVFYDAGVITNRQYLAEEYCRELRSKGREAYFHHGPVRSSVCVGLFPKEAVQAVQQTDPLTGAIQVTNRIVDERLLELQREFPYSLQNGHRMNEIIRDPNTGEIKQRIPLASFVVKTPRAERESARGR